MNKGVNFEGVSKLRHKFFLTSAQKSSHAKKIFFLFFFCATFFSREALAKELSLLDAISHALNNNLTVKIAEQERDIAHFHLQAVKGENGLHISLGDSLYLSKSEDFSTRSTNNLGLHFSYPLYLAGKDRMSRDMAKLNLDNKKLLFDREREKIKYLVIKHYYDALEQEKNVAIQKASLQNYAEHLARVNDLFLAGAKARVDVLRSSVALKNAEEELIKKENASKIALSTLKNFLFLASSEEITLQESSRAKIDPPTLDECISYAVRHRKDLKVMQNDVRLKNIAIESEETSKKLAVTLQGDLNHATSFQPQRAGENSYTLGIKASLNVFDQGVTRAKIKGAAIDFQNAILKENNHKQELKLEVEKAYYGLLEGEKRLLSVTSALKEAEENFYIVNEKYKVGAGTLLDIFDGELALKKARQNNASALYDYLRKEAELEYAMGLDVTSDLRGEMREMSKHE